MKNLSIVLLIVLLVGCKKNISLKVLNKLPKTHFKIKDPIRHYYAIQRGKVLTLVYQIENTGDEELVISKVQTSCGCLVSNFPKTSISPKRKGVIKLEFDSSKNIGYVEHYFTLIANTDSIFHDYKFDLNVVPERFTKDYEEVYYEQIKNGTIKLGTDGDNTQKQYYTNYSTTGEPVKSYAR